MALWDSADATARLISLFPPSWADSSEFQPGGGVYAVFNAIAAVFTFAYNSIVYTQLQTRLLTATGTNLEAIADDFFGVGVFPRGQVLDLALSTFIPQSDAAYATSIQAAVIGPQNTLLAIQTQLQAYLNEEFQVDATQNFELIGLDSSGGLDIFGYLDGVPQNVLPIPSVSVFDRQSSPKLAAQVPLTSGQFCILFTYGGLRTAGFFLGSINPLLNAEGGTPSGTFLSGADGVPLPTGPSYLLNPGINLLSGALTPQMAALVQRIKAIGFQPVYADNRVS